MLGLGRCSPGAASHRHVAFQLCQFLRQTAVFRDQCRLFRLGGFKIRGFQLRHQDMQLVRLRLQPLQRRLPGQGLDPAHPSSGCGILHNRKGPDIAGAGDMGAAAQFQRIGGPVGPLARPGPFAHRHHPHFVAIFFAKQRLCAQCAGIIRCHQAGFHGRILAQHYINFGLHRVDFANSQPLAMRKIKPQPVGRIQRPALRHMVAQRAAQRLV